MGGKGGTPAMLAEELNNYGVDVIDSQEITFVPTAEEDAASYDLGVALAKACKEL